MTLRPLRFTVTSSRRRLLLVLFLLLVTSVVILPCAHAARRRRRKNSHPDQRDIKIINDSRVTIDIRWIDPRTHKPAASNLDAGGLVYGGDTGINSYAAHRFLVEELPHRQTKKCVHGTTTCRKAYFAVSYNEDQVFTVTPNFLVELEDSHSRAVKKAKNALIPCSSSSAVLDATTQGNNNNKKQQKQALDELTRCLEANMNATITATQDEIVFQQRVRKDMAQRLLQYACRFDQQEESIPTSISLFNSTWTFLDSHATVPHRITRNLQVLFESPHSSIVLIEDFWSPSECQQVMLSSQPALAVAAPLGSNSSSSTVPLSAKQGNADVQRAMLKLEQLANHFLKGTFNYQRDPMLQLYTTTWPEAIMDNDKKEGEEEECVLGQDGTCLPHSHPSVVVEPKTPYNQISDSASVRIFCELPKRGGAIHLPQAGVHFKVSDMAVGTAVFMVYEDVETGVRDEDVFLKELVECPVKQGSLVQVIDHYALR